MFSANSFETELLLSSAQEKSNLPNAKLADLRTAHLEAVSNSNRHVGIRYLNFSLKVEQAE